MLLLLQNWLGTKFTYLVTRLSAWAHTIRWRVWGLLALVAIGAIYLVRFLLARHSDKVSGALDTQLQNIQTKLVEVEANAIEAKALSKAQTDEHVAAIKAAASEEDPLVRRQKLADQLNSL